MLEMRLSLLVLLVFTLLNVALLCSNRNGSVGSNSCSYSGPLFVSAFATIVPNQQQSSSTSVPSKIQRATLISKANELQSLLINKQASSSTTFVQKGWSNRAGLVVTPIHVDINNNKNNNVYAIERPFMWFGIDVGGRCTIIELPSSSGNNNQNNNKPNLFIHSPVALDDDILTILQKIGTVKYICSPNYEHVKYASQWYETFCKPPPTTTTSTTTSGTINPTGTMWACPGLAEKMTNIQWTGEIPYNYRPVGYQDTSNDGTITVSSSQLFDATKNGLCWDTTLLQPLHLNMEHNPFTNKPFFNEVLFYHVPTKTLLSTDFYWNYPNNDGITNSQLGYNDGVWELAPRCYVTTNDSDSDDTNNNKHVPIPTQLWKFGMDQIYKPFYQNFMIADRKEYNNIVHHILNVWDIETIVPCHGDIVRGKENVKKALMDALVLSTS